ncbi:MAG: hypothetical protein HY236_11550 [Acidobacteria bacterium]|nr:hypothetical protein [Acidobacteriota bacterium]
MSPLEQVREQLARYEHPLFDFSAREKDGRIELVIDFKIQTFGLHTYYLELHPRDFESSQFPWTFQRLLYDGMHDYVVEMFARTPQDRDARP